MSDHKHGLLLVWQWSPSFADYTDSMLEPDYMVSAAEFADAAKRYGCDNGRYLYELLSDEAVPVLINSFTSDHLFGM